MSLLKPTFPLLALVILFSGFTSCNSIGNKTAVTEKAEKQSLDTFLLQQGYSQLQIKKLSSGHLMLEGQINGVNGNFILDTGAGITAIHQKNKEKFKLNIAEKEEHHAVGAGGSGIEIVFSENNTIRFNDFEKRDLEVGLMNLDHVVNAFHKDNIEIHGVIGGRILGQGNAIIDYTNTILYLKKHTEPVSE